MTDTNNIGVRERKLRLELIEINKEKKKRSEEIFKDETLTQKQKYTLCKREGVPIVYNSDNKYVSNTDLLKMLSEILDGVDLNIVVENYLSKFDNIERLEYEKALKIRKHNTQLLNSVIKILSNHSIYNCYFQQIRPQCLYDFTTPYSLMRYMVKIKKIVYKINNFDEIEIKNKELTKLLKLKKIVDFDIEKLKEELTKNNIVSKKILLCKDYKLTQKQTAELLNLSLSTIKRYWNG